MIIFSVNLSSKKFRKIYCVESSHHVLQIYDFKHMADDAVRKSHSYRFSAKKISQGELLFCEVLKQWPWCFVICCTIHKPFSGHRGFVHNSILNTNDSLFLLKQIMKIHYLLFLKYMLQARCEWNLILKI